MRYSFDPMPIPAAGLAEGDQFSDAQAIVVEPAATCLLFGEGFKHSVLVFRHVSFAAAVYPCGILVAERPCVVGFPVGASATCTEHEQQCTTHFGGGRGKCYADERESETQSC